MSERQPPGHGPAHAAPPRRARGGVTQGGCCSLLPLGPGCEPPAGLPQRAWFPWRWRPRPPPRRPCEPLLSCFSKPGDPALCSPSIPHLYCGPSPRTRVEAPGSRACRGTSMGAWRACVSELSGMSKHQLIDPQWAGPVRAQTGLMTCLSFTCHVAPPESPCTALLWGAFAILVTPFPHEEPMLGLEAPVANRHKWLGHAGTR